jgi:intracellular multiplication protein IcmL
MSEENKRKRPPSPSGGKANPRTLKQAKQKRAGASSPVKRPAEGRGKPVKAPSEGDVPPLGMVVLRNEFYRDGYRSMLKLVVIQGVIILGMIVAMFFVIHTHQPENRYFATTEDGRLIPMIALHQPNLSTPALMSWVAQAATEVMTFGFNDYRRRLQGASRNFTPGGWESFTRALQQSRIIETIEEQQQVATAAPKGAPVLQSSGVSQGRYQWVVQMPMIITYESGAKKRTDNLLVTIVVVRVSRLESPNGVGIAQWIAVHG